MKVTAFIFKMVFRALVGVFLIMVINSVLGVLGFSIALGTNIYSIAMLCVLGVPSLLICYGLIGM